MTRQAFDLDGTRDAKEGLKDFAQKAWSFDPSGISDAQLSSFEIQLSRLSRGLAEIERDQQTARLEGDRIVRGYTEFLVAARHLNERVSKAPSTDGSRSLAAVLRCLDETKPQIESHRREDTSLSVWCLGLRRGLDPLLTRCAEARGERDTNGRVVKLVPRSAKRDDPAGCQASFENLKASTDRILGIVEKIQKEVARRRFNAEAIDSHHALHRMARLARQPLIAEAVQRVRESRSFFEPSAVETSFEALDHRPTPASRAAVEPVPLAAE